MKILFSDLDGTVIFDNKVKDEDLEAIKRFQKDGNLFVFCTGRGVGAIADVQKMIDPDYLCLNSGAHILDKEHNDLFKKEITKDTAKNVLKELEGHSFVEIIYTDKGMYLDGTVPYFPGEFPVLKDLDSINETIVGIGSLFENKDKAYQSTKHLDEISGEDFDVYQNEASLDVVAYGCSKGNSILKLIDILNIDLKDTYCIGDSYNDLTMFEKCPGSFTFNTSDEPIKESTKYLVNSVAEAIAIIEKDN